MFLKPLNLDEPFKSFVYAFVSICVLGLWGMPLGERDEMLLGTTAPKAFLA